MPPLAEYSVEIKAKGADDVRRQFDAIKSNLDAAEKAGVKMGDMTEVALKKMATQAETFSGKSLKELKAGYQGLGKTIEEIKGMGLAVPSDLAQQHSALGKHIEDRGKGVGGLAASAAGMLGGGLAGAGLGIAGMGASLAMKGVQSSAEFERLGIVMDRVSRIVGGALAPVLDAVTETFRTLTPAIRDISRAVGGVIGVVVDAFQPAFEALGPLLSELGGIVSSLTPIISPLVKLVGWLAKALIDLVAVVAKAVKILTAGLTDLLPKEGEKKRDYRELAQRGGGNTEALTATYARLQQAAIKTEAEIRDERTNWARKSYEMLIEVNTHIVEGNTELRVIGAKKGPVAA